MDGDVTVMIPSILRRQGQLYVVGLPCGQRAKIVIVPDARLGWRAVLTSGIIQGPVIGASTEIGNELTDVASCIRDVDMCSKGQSDELNVRDTSVNARGVLRRWRRRGRGIWGRHASTLRGCRCTTVEWGQDDCERDEVIDPSENGGGDNGGSPIEGQHGPHPQYILPMGELTGRQRGLGLGCDRLGSVGLATVRLASYKRSRGLNELGGQP